MRKSQYGDKNLSQKLADTKKKEKTKIDKVKKRN